jgi:hypothetical protein
VTDTHPLFADRPELDALAFAVVHRLHAQIPIDKRPTSWSDFSEAQVLRAKEATALAYDAGLTARAELFKNNGARAIVEDGTIAIRVPIASLQVILDGGYACAAYANVVKILDLDGAAKELCAELNDEDEEGTTAVHRIFDKAIVDALEAGSQCMEVIEEVAP